ncbi:LOW QUALITY PROTEIN: hypothetical protein U9M48_012204 [Paspalum notatum var. saurae]|uniref:Uncharacterized protein n=1 Tax=Paspalum notatum var. saurae TaxID=547442 RepID=A0AAQ3WIB6_PASNO
MVPGGRSSGEFFARSTVSMTGSVLPLPGSIDSDSSWGWGWGGGNACRFAARAGSPWPSWSWLSLLCRLPCPCSAGKSSVVVFATGLDAAVFRSTYQLPTCHMRAEINAGQPCRASWPGVQVLREPGLGNSFQRDLAHDGERVLVLHAQRLLGDAIREPPRIGVQQPKRDAGAHPAARSEGQQLHVAPLHVHAAPHEPLRPELAGVERRDVVAARGDVLAGQPRRQHRRRRVQAHRLLDDGLQVGEVRDVALRDMAVADDTVQLLGGLGEGVGTPQELRHGPFHRRRRGVRQADEEVLWIAISWLHTYHHQCPDAVAINGDLEVGVIGEREQQVHPVHGNKLLALSPPPLFVVVQDMVWEPIEHLPQPLQPADVPLRVQPVEPRDHVADVVGAAEKNSSIIHFSSSAVVGERLSPPPPTYFLPSSMRQLTSMFSMNRWSLSSSTRPAAGPACRRRSMAHTSACRACSCCLSRAALRTAVLHSLRACSQ